LRRGNVRRDFFLLVVSFSGPLNSAASVSFLLPLLSDVAIADLLALWIGDCPVEFRNPSLKNGIHSIQILDTFDHLLNPLVQPIDLRIV
jgi:hypothetical protein